MSESNENDESIANNDDNIASNDDSIASNDESIAGNNDSIAGNDASTAGNDDSIASTERNVPPRPKDAWPLELPDYDAGALTLSLAPLLDAPPLILRDGVEDFRVDEVPLYEPSGAGEHLFIHIEKTEVSTPQVSKRLQKHVGFKEREIGFAGRKDQRGVTSQWFSVPRVKAFEKFGVDDAAKIAPDALGEGVVILSAAPHKSKLRLGHLKNNRFRLVLRPDVDTDASEQDLQRQVEQMQQRAVTLEERGFPAYFGAQRFGHNSESIRQAERFLARGRRARSRKETFFVSIVQSVLCNRWISDRMADGSWLEAIEGEILLTRKGGPFWCDDPVTDSARVLSGEISPGAPMVGKKMRPARGDAATRESRSWRALALDPSIFETHAAFSSGERRPLRTFPSEIQVTQLAGAIAVDFLLPPGAYATVFIEELVGAKVLDRAFSTP